MERAKKDKRIIRVSPIFTFDLEKSMRNEAVRRLQQLLNTDPDTIVAGSGPGSPGQETNYYGSLTEKAVTKFQLKYKVISNPKAPGSGRVGPKTRAALRIVFSNTTTNITTSKSSKNLLEDKDRIAKIVCKYGLEVAHILAISDIESRSGTGFQKNGLLSVLFEAHCFYKLLKKVGLDPDALMVKYPNLISPTWNRKLYKGGGYENVRLAEAVKIHKCAWECVSYGIFQVMGFNYKVCGFGSVKEFVEYLKTGQEAHLDVFLRFISANPKRIEALRAKDWATFARLYNGPRYAENKYDIKLARAYEKYS